MASESDSDDAEYSLADHPYGDLMNLARSAREQFEDVDFNTDAPTKDNLVEQLEEYDPQGSRDDGWTIEVDGSRQDVELLAVQTPDRDSGSREPTDKTILYCLTRAETTEERLQEIRSALQEHTDFILDQAGTSGDKYAIVLPVENQDIEEPEPPEEEDDGEDEAEDDSDESDDGGDDADEDSSEDDSDESDDSESDDEDLSDLTKDELYSMAVEQDIDGRSDMDKDELIEALSG